MTIPVQLVIVDAALAPLVPADAPFVWAFRWDDQPEVATRAGRHARQIVEAVGGRGEGGFVRVVVGGDEPIVIEHGPAPLLSMRVGLAGAGLVVPEQIGPRFLAARERVAVARLGVGWLLDLAGAEHALEALRTVANAAGEHAFVLVGAGRFPVEALLERLVTRTSADVVKRLRDLAHAGRDAAFVAPAAPTELDVSAHIDEPPDVAAALALAAADAYAASVRQTIHQRLSSGGVSALRPLLRMLDELTALAHARVERRVPGPATATPTTPPTDALEAARSAVDALPARVPGVWPIEVAAALAGSVLLAGAVAPMLPPLPSHLQLSSVGGGLGVAGAVGVLAFLGAGWVTRAAQALARRRARRTLGAAEESHAAATAELRVAWRAPHAALSSRRAWARLGRALEAERARLAAAEKALFEPLPTRPGRPSTAETTFVRELDLEAAVGVLSAPSEPIVASIDAELRRPDWPEDRVVLAPSTIAAAAREAYSGVGVAEHAALPLAARADLADALRAPVCLGLAALRDELARWVPDGLPVRRFITLPAALADAFPDAARLDERQLGARHGWVAAIWRPG